jgi:antitoxin ChpS
LELQNHVLQLALLNATRYQIAKPAPPLDRVRFASGAVKGFAFVDRHPFILRSAKILSPPVLYHCIIDTERCKVHTGNLRKVGGSVMLAVPTAFLERVHLQVGASVGLAVDGDRLVVIPNQRPRYTLDELLAKCDAGTEVSAEDREWLDAPAVGDELL